MSLKNHNSFRLIDDALIKKEEEEFRQDVSEFLSILAEIYQDIYGNFDG